MLKKISVRVVGMVSLLMSLAGIIYTYSYYSVMSLEPFTEEMPYFSEAYHTMVVICYFFYLALAFIGLMFLRLKTNYRFLFLSLLIIEVVYSFSLGMLWRFTEESVAMSIGGATGVANVDLVAQGITLFPIWAPLIIFWAHSNKTITADRLRSG